MGIYAEQVVPRITNVLLGNKEFAKVRAEDCEGLTGDVIEIGFGSGLNLPHLPPAVTGLWAVDPSGVAHEARGEAHRRDDGAVPRPPASTARISIFPTTASTRRSRR